MVQFVGFGVGLAVCTLLDDQYKRKKEVLYMMSSVNLGLVRVCGEV